MKTHLFTSLLLLGFTLSVSAQTTQTDEAGKICMEGNNLYIVVPMHGFSIYDVTNSRTPREIRFVNLPGIVDIAVRGEFVYANQYQDLVLMKVPRDRAQPVTEIRRSLAVFPSRTTLSGSRPLSYNDFEEYKEEYHNYASSAPVTSVNGSMSCLTLAGNYIYAVEGQEVKTFNAQPTNAQQNQRWEAVDILPVPKNTLETIWTDGGNRVYLGSQTGLHIVDITDRAHPRLLGSYHHQRSCDPVVVVDNIAYSTQRNGRDCGGAVNQLDIVDISNPALPRRIRNYPMTNPHGLAVQNKQVLVCDGSAGLKVYNAQSPSALQLTGQVADIQAYDVLYDANKQIAYVSVPKELHLYSVQPTGNPAHQSVIVLPNMNN